MTVSNLLEQLKSSIHSVITLLKDHLICCKNQTFRVLASILYVGDQSMWGKIHLFLKNPLLNPFWSVLDVFFLESILFPKIFIKCAYFIWFLQFPLDASECASIVLAREPRGGGCFSLLINVRLLRLSSPSAALQRPATGKHTLCTRLQITTEETVQEDD